MKNITKSIIALFAILALSCTVEDVQDRPVIVGVDSPVLTAPVVGTAYVLLPENAAAQAERFTWKSANFDGAVAVVYTVQMDLKGGDFSKSQELGSVISGNQVAVSVEVMNAAALALQGANAVSGVAADFDIRVVATTGVATSLISAITPIVITPYIDAIPYPFTDWYLVGDASVAGWNNNGGNQPLFRSGTNPNEYKFTGFYKAGAFKLITKLGQWAPMYGKGAAGAIVARATESDPDPDSFVIATDGYYTFTMNTVTLTYTLVPYDASAAATYTTVGMIGSSTPLGWDGSTALTQSAFNSHVWTTTLDLKTGEAKFRANNAWDVAWGNNTAFAGFGLTANGPNIPVNQSKYKVYFNDLDGGYLMIPNQE